MGVDEEDGQGDVEDSPTRPDHTTEVAHPTVESAPTSAEHAPTTTPVTNEPAPSPKKKCAKQHPRTLEFLSQSMHEAIRLVTSTGMFLTVYDNINMVWKTAEQIVRCTGKFSTF